MSTRSVVAVPTLNGWRGRYCHWDGYPTCRGAQLFEAYRELGGDVEALREYATKPTAKRDGHWSSFMVPSEARRVGKLRSKITCSWCKGSGIRPLDEFKTVQDGKCNGCSSTGKTENPKKTRGWIPDDTEWFTESDADCGTEWAYVIEDEELVVYDRRWGSIIEDGGKMVGMFGQGAGADGGYWCCVGTFAWTEPEPDWEKFQERAYSHAKL